MASEEIECSARVLNLSSLYVSNDGSIFTTTTYRVVVSCLDLSSHQLPDERLETNNLVGCLERRAEREIQSHITGVARGVAHAQNLDGP